MDKILIPRVLLDELYLYLQLELKAWIESGSKEIPSILESLINDIKLEWSAGTCPQCDGPMVVDPAYTRPFCGSWLYMDGGCTPAPQVKSE